MRWPSFLASSRAPADALLNTERFWIFLASSRAPADALLNTERFWIDGARSRNDDTAGQDAPTPPRADVFAGREPGNQNWCWEHAPDPRVGAGSGGARGIANARESLTHPGLHLQIHSNVGAFGSPGSSQSEPYLTGTGFVSVVWLSFVFTVTNRRQSPIGS